MVNDEATIRLLSWMTSHVHCVGKDIHKCLNKYVSEQLNMSWPSHFCSFVFIPDLFCVTGMLALLPCKCDDSWLFEVDDDVLDA